MVCRTFISLVRTLKTVSLSMLTTNNADPSLEIARLRADLPVFTVLPGLLSNKFHEATFPDKFIVTYTVELSGEYNPSTGAPLYSDEYFEYPNFES